MIRSLLVLLLGAISLFGGLSARAQDIETWNGTMTLKVAGRDYVFPDLPAFEKYPAAKPPSKIAADIDWASHKLAKTYRTRLREGLKEGADFNGHYKVVSHGCGSGCQGNWVVDVETGKVLGQFYTSSGTLYRKDSGLLIADPLMSWEENETEDVSAFHDRKVIFFAVKKGRFSEARVFEVQPEVLGQMAKR